MRYAPAMLFPCSSSSKRTFSLLLFFLSLLPFAWAGSVSFNFTLPEASTTSAGAYDSDGVLVRTIWNNEAYPAGSNTGYWDGMDDNGHPVPADAYEVRILAHNVTYTWEGYIGNTSSSLTGTSVLGSYAPMQGMAYTSDGMFYVNGYNESDSLWCRLDPSDMNAVDAWGEEDFTRVATYITTDGDTVYIALPGTERHTNRPSFIIGVDATDNTELTFSNGTDSKYGTQGHTWNGIDYYEGEEYYPTGLGVQVSGDYLFISHGGIDQINVVDKYTGDDVSYISVTEPGALAVTSDGDFWVICKESGSTVVRRYEVDGSGNVTIGNSVITGLIDPLSIAVSPNNSSVLVADGGSSQQVKAYANVSTGVPSLSWTLGTAGGYNAVNGPAVTNTKFCFDESIPFIAFEPDGSFWLADAANERYLHFDSSQNYIEQIGFISHFYVATACSGDPTRVFAKWLEYEVDYSQPIKDCWTLVRNWRAGLPQSFLDNSREGFHAVMKLSNDRYYAVAPDQASGSSREILELPSSGCARQTGVNFSNKVLHEDGALRYQDLGLAQVTIYEEALTGFDGFNNPQFGSENAIATAPVTSTSPAANSYAGTPGRRFPITSGGILISSRTSGYGWYKALGGIELGSDGWLWQEAPLARYFDGKGSIGDANYPATTQFVIDENIVFCAHGEGYLGGQANQYLHFWENGLMVGQFGTDQQPTQEHEVVAGRTGNALSPSMVTYGDAIYMWLNDEWGTGIHRWKIDGTDGVTELSPITVHVASHTPSGLGLHGQYFNGINQDTFIGERLDHGIDFYWTGAPVSGVDSDDFSVRWSGLVEPKYSEDYTFITDINGGVRVWVDGTLVIDEWTVHSGRSYGLPISLIAGQLYDIRIEFHDTSGDAEAELLWESSSQNRQFVPFSCLLPSDSYAINCGGVDRGRFMEDPMGIIGNRIITTGNGIDINSVDDVPGEIIYQEQRQWDLSYGLGGFTPFANYTMKVHLAEINPSYMFADARDFDLKINIYDTVDPSIEIYGFAGGGYKAAIHEEYVTADNNGFIDVTAVSGNIFHKMIAALEFERSAIDGMYMPRGGNGTGLVGSYYSGTSFNTYLGGRIDPDVVFEWDASEPYPGTGTTNYTVRWEGRVLSMNDGTYTFAVNANSGKRLWVDGNLLIDQWSTSGQHSATISLEAGQFYDIKLEYINTGSDSQCLLKWSDPSTTVSYNIPTNQLFPPETDYTTILDAGTSSEVTFNGSWTYSVSVWGGWNNDYYHDGNNSKGSKSVVFAPDLPTTDNYRVYIRHTAGLNRADNVPVTVSYNGGNTTLTINQEVNNGQWIYLGTFEFASGSSGNIEVSNSGTNGHVIADAVKFERE
ncbi:PA14 domain-containing protein [Coraliomargarita parva]|uniref:PA14 domain-containing protein n=1 Tax=Coraliomargarita parva TaxID=3014050 RepID=UPI0022B3FFB5|nr:PA14 domain-containing protein [Coraliomargarita parva]